MKFASLSIPRLLAITMSVALLAANSDAKNKATTTDLQIASFPYYSTKGDWDSTFTLNNSTNKPLTASLKLYSLDGSSFFLSDHPLEPYQSIALRLSELLAQAKATDKFEEGSIAMSFNGSQFGIGSQLTVSDFKHGLSFDMKPAMGFKSSRLEGLWWSPDEETTGQVMLSNTSDGKLNLSLNVEWRGAVTPLRPILLTSHQTIVLEIENLLKELNVKAEGIEHGGLSLTHSGPPGALIAHGVVSNNGKRFASNLSFIDPAAQQSTVLEATGLFLSLPASRPAFPATTSFRPILALKNASTSSQKAKVTVQYTSNGVFQAKALPSVDLALHEVRMVDFSALMDSLRNVSVDDAGLKIEASGAAGSLVAQLTSMDENGAMCFDVPLTAVAPRFVGVGAHPFHLEGDYQAVVHLKNLGSKPTTAIVQLLYEGGEFTPDRVRIGPGQSVAIHVRQLRDSQAQDIHGHRLPLNLERGQAQWFQNAGEAVIGRLVSFSPSLGVSANFACPQDCCPPTYWSTSVNPSFITGMPGDSTNIFVFDTYRRECTGQLFGPFDVTGNCSFSSSNLSVAQVSFNNVHIVGMGSATIFISHDATEYRFEPFGDCGIPFTPQSGEGGGVCCFNSTFLGNSAFVFAQACAVSIQEETISPGGGALPVRNPARIARLFAPVFEAILDPQGCPVTWSILSGGGSIQGTNASPLVTVRGNSVGPVLLRATTSGGIFREINIPVVNQRVVEVRVRIVRRSDGTGAATSTNRVNNHLDQANKIWEQCGIRFQLVGAVQFINNSNFLSPNLTVRGQLRNTLMNTGGMEIYYIDSFAEDPGITGEADSGGVIIADGGNGRTLAHELGHHMGLAHSGMQDLHLMHMFFSNVNGDVRLFECDSLSMFNST